MHLVETEARLDLIELIAAVITNPDTDNPSELADLTEALCRHRELPVSSCLPADIVRMLRLLAADAYDELADRHNLPR